MRCHDGELLDVPVNDLSVLPPPLEKPIQGPLKDFLGEILTDHSEEELAEKSVHLFSVSVSFFCNEFHKKLNQIYN
tara:strand:- start:314 stop:541 length:228 start_codon:yes stop_codon:yes gene_type:complete